MSFSATGGAVSRSDSHRFERKEAAGAETRRSGAERRWSLKVGREKKGERGGKRGKADTTESGGGRRMIDV